MFIVLRRDSNLNPWAFQAASATRPVPDQVGEYLVVDLDTCGEPVTVAANDEAVAALRAAADAWRLAHNLSPLTDERAAALQQVAVTDLQQP